MCRINTVTCVQTTLHSQFIGQPFVNRFVCKSVRPMLYQTVVCPVCLPVTLTYCGQTVGWIKMPLGVEVGLGPGHIVLDGEPASSSPPTKRGTPFNFWPMFVVAKDQDATWYGARPRPRPHCVRWGPELFPKGAHQSPNFRNMSVVSKRLDGSRWRLVRRWASVQVTLC